MNSKIVTLLVFTTPLVCTKLSAQKISVSNYIDTYKGIAVQEMNRSGIPASITLAQGIHESGFGNSKLAREANNHFGIKCGSKWKGKEYYKWDDDPTQSCFRVYESAESSYIDHTEFLLKNQRYGFLFDYDRTDYKNWAKGLRRAGYASDPRYPSKLIATVEKYDLQIYDQENLMATSIQIEAETTNETYRNKKWSFLFPKRQRGFAIQNGANFVSAREGESTLQTAERWGIPYQKLLKFNDLKDGDQLIVHQRVYISPKKAQYQGEERSHRVEYDETMYEIAQYYGIKLAALLDRNLMVDGQEPATGTVILLKERKKSPPQLRAKNHVDLIPYFAQEERQKSITNHARPIVISADIKRPKPENLKINTALYNENMYKTPINTSKNKEETFEPFDIPRKEIELIPKDTILSGTLFSKPLSEEGHSDSGLSQNDNDNGFGETVFGDKIDGKNQNEDSNPTRLNYVTYTVQSGDSLSKIADLTKTSVAKIRELNRLNSDKIYPNQRLKIPN